jgi:integrase
MPTQRNLVANLPAGVGLWKTKGARGEEFYCVYLGKKFTGGASQRKFFKREKDARDWLNGEDVAKFRAPQAGIVKLFKTAHDLGLKGFTPTHEELTRALVELRRCKEERIELSEAVDEAIRRKRVAGNVVTLKEACDAVFKRQKSKDLSEGHLKTMKGIFDRVCLSLGKRRLRDIVEDDLEKWANKQVTTTGEPITETTRQSYYRYLGIVFSQGVSKKWCVENPLLGLKGKYVIKPQVVTVLKPDQMARLLGAALSYRKDLVASIAIKAFAGLRTSEVMRLDWSTIDDTALQVPAPVSKTNLSRVIEHIDPMRAWLDGRRKESGKVVDLNPKSWHNAVDSLARMAGITIVRNSIRHSFGTYRHFILKSSYHLSEEMGNSPRMAKNRYVNLAIPKADRKSWWLITPEVAKEAFARHLKGKKVTIPLVPETTRPVKKTASKKRDRSKKNRRASRRSTTSRR